MKVCRGCKEDKMSSQFNMSDHIRKDGTRNLRSHCNDCRSTGTRKWYAAHKDQAKTTKKIYEEKNADKVVERRRRYMATHGKENRARAAAWYKENPERGKANAKIAHHKRRAIIAEVGGTFTKADIKNMYATQGARCYYCSISIEDKYEIDHMNPIIRGGSNWVYNICLACVRCNRSKHTKTAEEFMNADR